MTVAALGYRNIKGQFFLGLERISQLTFTPSIASVYDSDQESEIYKFLDEVPAMQKQGASGAQGGPQVRRTLKDNGIQVFNEIWEAPLYFNKHDLRRDKTGQALKRIDELSERAAELPDKLVSAVIEANPLSYDGVALYSSSHATGSNDITVNGIASVVAATTVNLEQVIRQATQQMFVQKDAAGEPANQFARKFAIMVHPDAMGVTSAAIRNLTTADAGVVVRSTTGALQQEFGVSYVPIVNPRLTTNTKAYLFRVDSPIRTLIWQDEVLPDIIMLDENSEHAKKTGEIYVRAERLCAAAVGRHQMGVRVTMAA